MYQLLMKNIVNIVLRQTQLLGNQGLLIGEPKRGHLEVPKHVLVLGEDQGPVQRGDGERPIRLSGSSLKL